jgi:tetratricopeptide (TPR) repeat protein
MLGKFIEQIILIGNKLQLVVLCCLIIFLPSVSWQGFANPTESSKLIFFYYALLILITLVLVHLVVTKSLRIHITAADLFFLFLVIYIFLDRYIFQSYSGFSLKFYQLIGLILLYVILRRFYVSEYVYLLLAVLAGSIIQAINGLLQLVGFLSSNSIFAITGNFANPGAYAGFLAISGVLALGMYLYRDQLIAIVFPSEQAQLEGSKRVVNHLFYYMSLLCLACVLIILPALRSRAAWIAFITGTSFLLIIRYNWHKAVGKIRPTAKLFAIPVIIVLIVTGITGIYQFKKDSADGRVLIYKITSQMIKHHPFVGIGFDRFKADYMNAQADWFKEKGLTTESSLADNTYYAFNEPLQFSVENGLIGLLLISISVLIFINIKTSVQYNVIKQLSLSILSSVLMFGFFTYLSDNLPITMLLIIALALMANVDISRNFFNTGSVFLHHKKLIVAKVFLIVALIAVIWNGIQFTQGIQSDFTNWGAAQEEYNRTNYTNSLILFEKADHILYDDGDYLMQYGKALVMAAKYGKAVTVLQWAKLQLNNTVIETALGDSYKALGNYQLAEHAYQQAANMVPDRFYPHYLLAKLYVAAGEKEKAIQKAKEIISKKIKIPSTAITEMRNEMKALAASDEKEMLLKSNIKVAN